MQAKYSWLLLPPAIALLIFLGPLGGSTNSGPAGVPSAGPAAGPTVTQIASTLLGVLLLGGVGIVAFGRLRGAHGRGGAGPLALRQSLRLSARHTIHVVEFDNRMLLIGEADGHVTVLDGTGDAGGRPDEPEIDGRSDDDGAVPRDLLIPRTEPASRATPPRTRTTAAAAQRQMATFRNLLELARPGAKAT